MPRPISLTLLMPSLPSPARPPCLPQPLDCAPRHQARQPAAHRCWSAQGGGPGSGRPAAPRRVRAPAGGGCCSWLFVGAIGSQPTCILDGKGPAAPRRVRAPAGGGCYLCGWTLTSAHVPSLQRPPAGVACTASMPSNPTSHPLMRRWAQLASCLRRWRVSSARTSPATSFRWASPCTSELAAEQGGRSGLKRWQHLPCPGLGRFWLACAYAAALCTCYQS